MNIGPGIAIYTNDDNLLGNLITCARLATTFLTTVSRNLLASQLDNMIWFAFSNNTSHYIIACVFSHKQINGNLGVGNQSPLQTKFIHAFVRYYHSRKVMRANGIRLLR